MSRGEVCVCRFTPKSGNYFLTIMELNCSVLCFSEMWLTQVRFVLLVRQKSSWFVLEETAIEAYTELLT